MRLAFGTGEFRGARDLPFRGSRWRPPRQLRPEVALLRQLSQRAKGPLSKDRGHGGFI